MTPQQIEDSSFIFLVLYFPFMSMKHKSSNKAKYEGRPTCSFFCYKSSGIVVEEDVNGSNNQTVSLRPRRKRESLKDDGTENIFSASFKEYSVAQGNKHQTRNNRTKSPSPTEFKETLNEPGHIRRLRQPDSPEPNLARTGAVWVRDPSGWAEKLDDPIVGLTVLGMTLAVMVVSGGAAAVAFLIACVFVAGLLRRPPCGWEGVVKGGGGEGWRVAGEVNLESKKHKKRILLEGLLDRTNLRTSVHGFANDRRSGGA